MHDERSLHWAELKRETEVLLIPSMAWEAAIFARGRSGQGKEDAWEEELGAWRVTDSQATLFAEVVERLPVSYFGRSRGSQDFGPFAIGTVVRQALNPADAEELKLQTMRFLAAGEFTWRFISL
jgi:hypothetical protein